MVVGILRLSVEVPGAMSLKDKRAVIRSLRDRIQAKFHLAVAEVGNLDDHRHGEIGVACLSNGARHADEILNHVVDFAHSAIGDGVISDVSTEILHVG
jgi:uncharacterized protein YlxP (DUF503 family)